MNIPNRNILTLMACALIAMCSCIKNDIPYPRIQANFTYMSAEGQLKSAAIDSTSRVVTLFFAEDANIYEVKIDSFAITPNSEIVEGAINAEPLDLSAPVSVTLRLYQDYQWTIQASQNVEREFEVDGQIGVSVIDVPGCRVLASVSDRANLSSLQVKKFKLGPSSCSYIPDLLDKYVDFSHPVVVNVDNYGHIEKWTIYVTQTESTVSTIRADGWTKVAWVYGEAQADKTNTIQYRIKGDTEWLEAPESWMTRNGGNFHARLVGLTPNTTYETRAVSDGDFGEVLQFTTGSVVQMPNSDFDHWWLDGKVWCPWAEDGTPYWDTGNKGATTLGSSNSMPTDDTVTGTGQAARLETRFVGIGLIGKLAAGNVFVGSYVRTEGTNGVLSFGRPFNEHPTKLTGYFKYQTAPISSVTSGFEDLKGRPDSCSVWVALIDTPDPFEIRTNPSNRQLFDPEGDYVVAYGKMVTSRNVEAYEPFEVMFNYTSTSRVPTYIICAASSSQYGDFFTGGNGALMFVDDFKLEYDY